MKSITVGLLLGLVLGPAAPGWALEQTTERTSNQVEAKIDTYLFRGTGKWWGDVARGRVGLQVRRLNNSPYFLDTEIRADYERREPYDLVELGAHVGIGRELTESTDALLRYRFDNYNVYDTGNNVDPAFHNVTGATQTTALAFDVVHDTRDMKYFPTQGVKTTLTNEVALKALGGDYNFYRLEGAGAVYGRPFRNHPTGTLLDDVVLVEHAQAGWVENFGPSDDVPFFERYFVGSSRTVRGQRSQWLTPRGLEDEFVGGEIVLINNMEARLPIFKDTFNERLSAATFFDMGRSYRKFSDIGDFGYAVGAGLRYIVHAWVVHGVLRVDYALNLDTEGDNNRGRFHITLGLPF